MEKFFRNLPNAKTWCFPVDPDLAVRQRARQAVGGVPRRDQAETVLPWREEAHGTAGAVDPETGQRYPDVIVIRVPSELDKLALVQDPWSPFFTTPHFDGHLSMLVRASRLGETDRRRTGRGDRGRLAVPSVPGPPRGLSGERESAGHRGRLEVVDVRRPA
jgi:hypothetical protein